MNDIEAVVASPPAAQRRTRALEAAPRVRHRLRDLGLDVSRDPVRDRDAAAVPHGRHPLLGRRCRALRVVALHRRRRAADARELARRRHRRLGLLLGGNGLLVWSEFRIPSGVAALLVGVVPCCMVLIEWLRPHGTKPGAQVVLGLVLGLAGLLFLVGPSSAARRRPDRPRGHLCGDGGCFSWAAGSIYARHGALPRSPFLATAMQMLVGGLSLTIAGVLHGELAALDAARLLAALDRGVGSTSWCSARSSRSRRTCGSCA